MLFSEIHIAFVSYHDESIVECHVKCVYGLSKRCAPFADAYTRDEMIVVGIKDFGAAPFVGYLYFVVGPYNTVWTTSESFLIIVLFPLFNASDVLFASVCNIENLKTEMIVGIVKHV